MVDPKQSIQVVLYREDRVEQKGVEIVVETPVSLTINGEIWLDLMCTPVDLESLGIGFLYNEGVIQSIEEIASVHVCESGDNIDIWLQHKAEKPSQWRRTSGCTGGVTSVNTNSVVRKIQPQNEASITPNQVSKLINALFESQEIYHQVGGIHTSALSDGEKMLIVAEDIGRHNTLDKIAGRCLLEHLEFSRRILLTTGRISSEMIQKAARLRATFVISRTSPSSLSIQMAERGGITLIGYARHTSFRVYTHPERILSTSEFKKREVNETHAQGTKI